MINWSKLILQTHFELWPSQSIKVRVLSPKPYISICCKVQGSPDCPLGWLNILLHLKKKKSMENIHEPIFLSFFPPNDFGGSILTDWACTGVFATYTGADYCTYNCAPACSWAEITACPNLWISPEIKDYYSLSCVYTFCAEAASCSLLCLSVCNAAFSCCNSFKSYIQSIFPWRDFPLLKLFQSTHYKMDSQGLFKQSFAGNSGKFQNIHRTVVGIPCNARSSTGSYNSTPEKP